ncbi:TrkA family potassium uptake protein [Haloferax larsenii]|uniref:TrkA family potassium uptake protein n=1 Tax=Haloferax larsenii TaxID=302484 RepID=A0ABY5RFS5_HALLR|nr:TrkA family potassium uptake protein [Haloferax larsenii]ELZ79455.1 TRK potassium uptake system protein [Haloferax larsenii JCM 13917]UVE50890.1 TrkA family potassium uptake protein [Haloferax larsenii]
MKFVIVGYGRVGTRTARILREEGHAVTVVDNDETKVDRALDEGFDTILGDGGTESVLKQAGIEEADAVGGLTGDPNINFAACMLGKEFGCRTVMRISEDYRQEIYERYADDVDEIIYPERLGAAGAKTALLGGDFNALGDLTDKLRLATVTVPENAPIVGEHVASIDLGADGRIYAHGRKREPMTIPLPGTVVEPGDHLALLTERDELESVRTRLLG